MGNVAISGWFRAGRIASLGGQTDEAVRQYREGVSHGCVRCMLVLSGRLLNKEEPWHDPKEALRLLEMARDAGSTEALEGIGVWYKNGEGGYKDIEKAVRYLSDAARSGQPEAMRELALIHLQESRYMDPAEAMRLLKMAAHHGHPPSCYTYALVLWDGVGGRRDKVESVAWMSLAAEFDYKDSRERLEMVGLGATPRIVLVPFWRRRVNQRVTELMSKVSPYIANPEDDELYEEAELRFGALHG